MIKSKAILRKSFRMLFSEDSDLQLFNRFKDSFIPHRFVCPSCHQSGVHSSASSYSRMIISVENGKRVEYLVQMPRIRCACGRCHAVIPDFLIPYGSYTIRFILHVLKEYLKHTSTVTSLCDHWNISVSTLYEWIHRFRSHFNLWSGIMNSISSINMHALDKVSDTIDFPVLFLQLTASFSFLQNYTTLSQQCHKT